MKRSLLQLLRTNYPGNLKTAVVWLIWTVGSVVVSITISIAVSFAKKHYVSIAEGITHGELFAFSASLVIGSGRLILKDEDLEDFVGRQFFGLAALVFVFFSEVFFFLWKLDETGSIQGPFGRPVHASPATFIPSMLNGSAPSALSASRPWCLSYRLSGALLFPSVAN